MRRGWTVLVLALGACSSSSGSSDAGAEDAGLPDSGTPDGGAPDSGTPDGGPLDAGPSRAFRLAATGMQVFTTDAPTIFQWTPSNLGSDVDVVGFFGEFYGVPWEQFADGGGPSQAWATQMTQLAAAASALQKPIFLSLTVGRDGLINRVVDLPDAGYAVQSGWAPCFDFSADGGARMAQAYADYTAWMANAFHPRWLNVGVEVNLYGVNCPSAWPGVAHTVNLAYERAKSLDAGTIVFESYVLETLNGLANCPAPMTSQQCADADYARIALLERDRFGLSTYPGGDPSSLPADYFVRAANRNDAGPERVIIAETGYNSASIVVGDGVDAGSCADFVPSTPALEAAYIQRILADAASYDFELVDWWADRDLLPEPLMTGCPCTYAADWCALEGFFQSAYPSPQQGDFIFKAFGSMGLRNYDGSPKAGVLPVWQAIRNL